MSATLLGLPQAPASPMASSDASSWISIVLPSAWFTQAGLEGLVLTAASDGLVLATGWAFSVAMVSTGSSSVPVLSVYPTSTFTLAPASTVLLAFTSVPTAGLANPSPPTIGALFWNEASAAANDSRTTPHFWVISSAPNPEQLTTPLPLVASWVTAQFSEADYQANFTSDQIGRPPDAVYATGQGNPGLENNLALLLDFVTQGNSLGAGATSSASISIGVLAADRLANPPPPFLTAANCLVTSTDVGSDASVTVLSDNGNWQSDDGNVIPNTPFFVWTITFHDGAIIAASDSGQVLLQIDQLISAIGQYVTSAPPYATAALIFWQSLPGYVNGCITLPLMSLAPQPAAVQLTTSPTSEVAYGGQVTVTWAAYAAQSVSLLQTAPSGASQVYPLTGTGSSISVPSNPFTTQSEDINAKEIGYRLNMTPWSGSAIVGPQVQLSFATPTPQFEVTGAWAADSTGLTTTTFTITAPANIYNCVVTAPGANQSTTISGGQSGPLAITNNAANWYQNVAAGGALQIVANAPGGPFTIPWVEATSWTPSPLPAAGTLIFFAYQPAGGSPGLAAGLYVLQPGYPPRLLSSLAPGADTYNFNFNNLTSPSLLVGPTSGNTTTLYIPGTATNAMSTVEVTWGATGPTLAAGPTMPMWDGNAPAPSGVVGPILAGGAGVTTGALNNPPPNLYDNGPSPRLTVLSSPVNNDSQVWLATITASQDTWQARMTANVANPQGGGLLKAVATNFPPAPPLGACQPWVIIGDNDSAKLVWDGGAIDLQAQSSCDIDFDVLNNRLVASAFIEGGSDPFFYIYLITYDYNSGKPVVTQLPCLPLGISIKAATLNDYWLPLTVGRSTGTIYTLGQLGGWGSDLTIATVEGSPNTLLPLFGFSGATTEGPQILSLAVLEPPLA